MPDRSVAVGGSSAGASGGQPGGPIVAGSTSTTSGSSAGGTPGALAASGGAGGTGGAGGAVGGGGAGHESGAAAGVDAGGAAHDGGAAGAAGATDEPAACGTVASGAEAVRLRYENAHVAYGATCVSEEQHAVCTDGELGAWSGAYVVETCTAFPASDCGSTAHGQSAERTRYQATSVAYGSSCVSEKQQALCQNGALGTWSGSFAFEECNVLPPSSCGVTAHGATATRTRYLTSAVPYGSSCVSEEQSAVCSDGNLGAWSGSFLFNACSVGPAASCDGVLHGSSEERTLYANTSVAYGEACEKETQTRTCNDGFWSDWTGSYVYESCEIVPPAPCGDIPHGRVETQQRYANYSVPFGSSCVSEEQTRVCTNGTFSSWTGTYQHTSCSVQECANGSLQTRACGRNNRGQQTRPCDGGAWRSAWNDCVDPDVCSDGQAGASVACNAGAGWQARTCVQGQLQVTADCGVCSGTFKDPCLENKTDDACFAARYDGLSCGAWNESYFPPRCELDLNISSYARCSNAQSQAGCRPVLGCSWMTL